MKSDEKRCPDCAEIIKTEAAVCKHCGRRFTADEMGAHRGSLPRVRWGCLAAVVGFFILVALIGQSSTDTASPTTNASDGGQTTTAANSVEAGPTSKWSYNEQRDDMRGRTDKFAELKSENEQEFSFPYNGGSHLSIQLQKFRKPEADVLLRLEKGQFICHSFTGGSVSVRFDGGPVRKYGCSDTSDADTSAIFLHPAGSFISALKKSSKVTVEAEFFQEGVRQYTFDSRGLKWQ